MTIDTARENSGAIANNFDKDKVQSEINLQVEVTKKFDQNRQEVKAEINKKIDKAKSENQSILDKQEGGIPLSREEEQQLAAYNKKVENYQQLGVLLDVVTSGLSSPTSSGLGIAASSLSPVASYEIGQYFKEKGTEGSSAHILAHTVLGAAVAAAGGNDALTAGLVAGGAEAAAPALSSFLYNKKTSDLTADEKSTISAITGLVATGIGGIASGGDIATAVQSGQGAQNAVENNYLSELDVKILVEELNQAKTEVEKEEIYKKFAELSKEKSELAAIECIDVESLGCKQEIINIKNGLNFINDQNAVIDYLAYERVDNKIEPMDGGLHLEIVKSFDAGSLYFEISKSPQTYEEYKNQTEVRFVEYENLSDLSKYANSELSSDIKKYLGSKDYEYSNQPFLDKPWGSMYVAPALQIVGGGLTVAGAAVIGGTLCETVIGCVVAGYLAGSGGDDIRNGGINWGQEPIAHQATLREQLLRSMGMSE